MKPVEMVPRSGEGRGGSKMEGVNLIKIKKNLSKI
jgi:hypothetical protein